MVDLVTIEAILENLELNDSSLTSSLSAPFFQEAYKPILGSDQLKWIDVRSPSEFEHAHIPSAYNLPLFSDEERAQVGTCYKKEGALQAMQLGLRFVIARLPELQQQLSKLAAESRLMIYCARGGMRSEYVALLAQSLTLPTQRLKGGYKAFRSWVLTQCDQPYSLNRVGGMTGSGKTELLQRCEARGGAVIDLEALADHAGSCFGGFRRQVTWGTEMFENRLAMRLLQLSRSRYEGLSYWVEDESRMIGPCKIPDRFYEAMQNAPLFYLEATQEQRIARLLEDYSELTNQEIMEACQRLKVPLANSSTLKKQLALLVSNPTDQLEGDNSNPTASSSRRILCEELLAYYDRRYQKSRSLIDYQTLSQPVFSIDQLQSIILQPLIKKQAVVE